MAKFSYEVTIPNSGTYEVESDKELSDADAYKYALAQVAPSAQTLQTTPPKSGGLADLLIGAAETALTLGTAATGGLFGTVGGILANLVQEVSKAFSDFWTNGLQPVWETSIKPVLVLFAELFDTILIAVDFVIGILGTLINYIIDIVVVKVVIV